MADADKSSKIPAVVHQYRENGAVVDNKLLISKELATKEEQDTIPQGTDQSREPSPPPLPPRPAQVQHPLDGVVAWKGSLHASKGSTRPQLLSKTTTALSLTDIHTLVHGNTTYEGTPSPLLRTPSRQTSISNFGRRLSHEKRDVNDKAGDTSVIGYAPMLEAGQQIEGFPSGSFESPTLDDTDTHSRDGNLFQAAQHEDVLFNAQFRREFDELEEVKEDGSNEETLMLNWRSKLKHFFILSSAGKPIYSRHGDDQLISNSIGVVQTIISFYQGEDDVLKGFTAGDTRFVILSKGHLHLVATSRLGENDAQLRGQLEAMYMQILSTLTLPNMERMFLNRPSIDLRRPLEGTEILLSALADSFTRGSPSTLLSALECLRLRKSHRQVIDDTLLNAKSPNLLYGLVVAGGRLASVLRPKKHSLHPGDLQLIFNMLFVADGVRAAGGENWIPLCLPGYNNTGYLYMYVSFLVTSNSGNIVEERSVSNTGKNDEIAILLISAKKESFFELKKMRDKLVKQLDSNGSISALRAAVRKGRSSCADIIPGTVIRHFLYKSRANVQFTMPSLETLFEDPVARRRLMSAYSRLHANVHGRIVHLKVHYSTGRDHVSLAWITPLFEMYCVASPTASRNTVVQGANKVLQWIRKEEERLFIIGGAGGSVAKVFQKESGWKIRGITRDPDKASNKSLRDAGVELVAADLDDPTSLKHAFAGANAIFGVTDFWQFMWAFLKDPAAQKTAADQGKTLNQMACDRELQQGKNLIDAVATVGPSLERFVLSTLSETKKWSKGKYTWNYHFDGKAEMVNYLKATHPDVAAKTSYLQVGIFMANWQMAPLFSFHKQPDGTFKLSFPSVTPSKPIPYVHPPHDTGHFVRALVLSAPAGTNLLGVSDPMTASDWAQLWGRLNGVQCRFEPIPLKAVEDAMPPGLGREIGESCLYASEFGYDGGDPSVVLPKDVGVDVGELMTCKRYIEETDWSSVLGKEGAAL